MGLILFQVHLDRMRLVRGELDLDREGVYGLDIKDLFIIN